MITVHLDKNAGKTLYMQLYESIKKMIIEGELKANDALPSKRVFAARQNISIKTVENAYYQLELEGYITSRERSGFYVNQIERYYSPPKRKTKKFETAFKETHYKVNFKSNRSPKSTFPKSIWYRLLREQLSDDSDVLLDTVPFNGLLALREAIATDLYTHRGMVVSPDNIIIGSGTEYLYGRILQLFGNDRVFALEDPGYTLIRKICTIHNIPYVSIPLDDEGISIDSLKKTNANIVHISPSQHFPLGFVTPINRRIELLEWANEENDRYIIEDDYNSEYRYHGNPIPTLYSITVREKVIYMNTFSKTVAPSLRISYMILPSKLLKRYIETMSFYSCTVSALHQLTLAKFISDGYMERYINRIKHRNIPVRESIREMIAKSSISDRLQLIENKAGTHFLLKVDTKLSDEILVHKLKDNGIMLASVLEYMEIPDEKYKSMLVLNYSDADTEQIRYFIGVMENILEHE